MGQEVEMVKDVVRLVYDDELKNASGAILDMRADPDDALNYRYWGFSILQRVITTQMFAQEMDIYVYHSHDGTVWGELDFIQNTEHFEISRKYRKERRYFALYLYLYDVPVFVTVSTILGNS